MIRALYMAPIRGVTDYIYRRVYSAYFSGFDIAVAPFIAVPKGNRIKSGIFKDVSPENNIATPVIPQLLGKDADEFALAASRLFDLGYTEINWNLGCPFPMVAKKQRGSGLLPHPEKIDAFLNRVIPKIPNVLSVKTRIGREHRDEILRLAPVFNRYPLSEIIVHPRTGVQMYSGSPDLEMFETVCGSIDHPIVYNGDITNTKSFEILSERFPEISRWMIGRGALTDPFLPGDIRKKPHHEDRGRIRIVRRFHDHLYNAYRDVMSGPAHPMDRMKGLWTYMARSFAEGRKILKKIHRAKTPERYMEIVNRFFDDDARWEPASPDERTNNTFNAGKTHEIV